jgi:hypothetical protein
MLIGRRMPEMRHLHNSCVFCTFISCLSRQEYMKVISPCFEYVIAVYVASILKRH